MNPIKRRAFTLIELLIVIAIIVLLAAILFPVFSRARESARRSSCASNLKQMALGMIQYVQDYDERFPSDRPNPAMNININTRAPHVGSCNVANNCVRWFWPDLISPYVKSSQIFNDASRDNGYFEGCSFYAGAACSTDPPARAKHWIYQGPYNFAIDHNDSNSSQRTNIAYGYAAGLSQGAGGIPQHLNSIVYPAQYLLLAESDSFQINPPGLLGENCGNIVPRHFNGVNVAYVDGHVKWANWDALCALYNADDQSKKVWMADGENYP